MCLQKTKLTDAEIQEYLQASVSVREERHVSLLEHPACFLWFGCVCSFQLFQTKLHHMS